MKNTFKSSYFQIDKKINKREYIKKELQKDKPVIRKEIKQVLNKHEEEALFNIVNRDLIDSTCDKVTPENAFIGRFE